MRLTQTLALAGLVGAIMAFVGWIVVASVPAIGPVEAVAMLLAGFAIAVAPMAVGVGNGVSAR